MRKCCCSYVTGEGIDYRHPDFQNPDGTTRILALWDQSVPGRPPEGYRQGTVYTREEINEALQAPMMLTLLLVRWRILRSLKQLLLAEMLTGEGSQLRWGARELRSIREQ